MEKHKRYLVFGYLEYYPNGGMNDLSESYDTIEEAKAAVEKEKEKSDFVEIYDRVEGIIIYP